MSNSTLKSLTKSIFLHPGKLFFKTIPEEIKLRLATYFSRTQLISDKTKTKLVKAVNERRFSKSIRKRKALYKNNFKELLEENGGVNSNPTKLVDGWALDKTKSLPHLQSLMDTCHEVSSRKDNTGLTGRKYMVLYAAKKEWAKHPEILDFATSSTLISILADYFQSIPVLMGILLFRSEVVDTKELRESQYFHIDREDVKLVSVVIMLEDVTEESGPFCFLPVSASTEAREKLNYGGKGSNLRVTDETMYKVIDENKLVKAITEEGSVLFVDTGNSFHYGSRCISKSRLACFLTYITPARADLGEVISPDFYNFSEFVKPGDSRLRKMVLDRNSYS